MGKFFSCWKILSIHFDRCQHCQARALGLVDVCELTRFTFDFVHNSFFLPIIRAVFRFLKNDMSYSGMHGTREGKNISLARAPNVFHRLNRMLKQQTMTFTQNMLKSRKKVSIASQKGFSWSNGVLRLTKMPQMNESHSLTYTGPLKSLPKF